MLCLVAQPCPTLCNSMDCSLPGSSVHGDSPGKNTGVGCHALLQGIFSTLGSNPGLSHCRQILYHLSHQGSPGVYALKVTYYISCLGLPSQNTTDDGLNNRNSFFWQIRGQKKAWNQGIGKVGCSWGLEGESVPWLRDSHPPIFLLYVSVSKFPFL